MTCSFVAGGVFWVSLFLLLYAYFFFANILRFCAKTARKRNVRTDSFKPRVTVIVPVYNEEKVIARKIENCLALEYPHELIEIMICSDCSSDSTDAIIHDYSLSGITVIRYGERSGKTGVLNKSVPRASGEIIVLTDANTMLEKDAVSKLVSMYASEEVGAVLGQVKLVIPEGGHGLQKEIVYREFEAKLKFTEGLFGAAIGAFGGFYSIRKNLFEPLPFNAYSNDDLIIPMKILLKGRRVLFDASAVSTEDTAKTVAEEFRRRVRIGAGNFQSFFLLLGALNPFRPNVFLLYVSHKVLRWFSPFLLLLLLITGAALRGVPVYRVFFTAQVIVYGVALLGYLLSRFRVSLPVIASIYHFISMNLAVFLGFFRYLRGIRSAIWESTGRTAT